MQSESISKLAEALSLAQSEIANVSKNSINPHFKNKYADLSAVVDVLKDTFPKHGLAFVQLFNHGPDGSIYLSTQLMHKSGEWLSGEMRLLVDRNNMQGLGSACTYARRYSLMALAGISAEDDDGNAACKVSSNPL